MKIKIWGCRGSIPVPGPDTQKYGGNTACIELVGDNGERIIFDAGTGIRELGNELLKNGEYKKINLMISHTHWDHIIGFPFFTPIYLKDTELTIYGPVHYEKNLKDVFAILMDYSYFPISAAQLAASVRYVDLKEQECTVGELHIKTKYLNHPVLNLGYRVEHNGKIFVYTGDHEPYFNVFGDKLSDIETDEIEETIRLQNEAVVEFFREADLLIADSTYTAEEYKNHIGWGHSSIEQVIDMSRKANVKHTIFTHHDPSHTDEILDALAQKYSDPHFEFAVEKNEYTI